MAPFEPARIIWATERVEDGKRPLKIRTVKGIEAEAAMHGFRLTILKAEALSGQGKVGPGQLYVHISVHYYVLAVTVVSYCTT